MNTLQESLESERLARIISEKEAYYRKLFRQDPSNQYLTILNSEITFLRDIIMPIVLQNTTVLYSQLAQHVTQAMRAMEKRQDKEKYCGVLLYYQTRQPEKRTLKRVAMASNVRTFPDIDVSMYINGSYVLITPVSPDDYEKEQDDWYAEQSAKIRDKRINTNNIPQSTQKFVKP